jgi:hypothetical protein
MATKPSGAAGRNLPGGNPMNLTCTTIAPSVDDGPPQMVKIIIHSNGNVPNLQGWTQYLPPEPGTTYKLRNDDNGEESEIDGSGVAIFTKDAD